MITEPHDHKQKTDILPPVGNDIDTKDTKCQRGCAALIKGGGKCSTAWDRGNKQVQVLKTRLKLCCRIKDVILMHS